MTACLLRGLYSSMSMYSMQAWALELANASRWTTWSLWIGMRLVLVPNERMEDVVVLVVGCGLVVEGSTWGLFQMQTRKGDKIHSIRFLLGNVECYNRGRGRGRGIAWAFWQCNLYLINLWISLLENMTSLQFVGLFCEMNPTLYVPIDSLCLLLQSGWNRSRKVCNACLRVSNDKPPKFQLVK